VKRDEHVASARHFVTEGVRLLTRAVDLKSDDDEAHFLLAYSLFFSAETLDSDGMGEVRCRLMVLL
jgi:hypothetical protein